MGQRRLEQSRERESKEEAIASDEDEETDSVMSVLVNLIIEMVVTEEDSVEGLEDELAMLKAHAP